MKTCPDCGAPFHDCEIVLRGVPMLVRDCGPSLRLRRRPYEPPAVVESRDVTPVDLANFGVRETRERASLK